MFNKRFTLCSTAYLLLIINGRILLLRRFNTGWEDGKYSLISGHLNGNETITQAMIREAKEEAGIKIKRKDLKVAHVMNRKSNEDKEYIDFFLKANKWEGEPKNIESDKCDNIKWFSLNKLPDNLLLNVRKAIEDYLRNIYFSEFGWE